MRPTHFVEVDLFEAVDDGGDHLGGDGLAAVLVPVHRSCCKLLLHGRRLQGGAADAQLESAASAIHTHHECTRPTMHALHLVRFCLQAAPVTRPAGTLSCARLPLPLSPEGPALHTPAAAPKLQCRHHHRHLWGLLLRCWCQPRSHGCCWRQWPQPPRHHSEHLRGLRQWPRHLTSGAADSTGRCSNHQRLAVCSQVRVNAHGRPHLRLPQGPSSPAAAHPPPQLTGSCPCATAVSAAAHTLRVSVCPHARKAWDKVQPA